ncbi:hypothetical protein M514_19064 [Trichuris suis]|uniref:Uncharacterized protein n=1 Tax=Trichuris suis TaxID=68888 RepID=A0A085NH77_9BILA|nr:hypothetical protein M514_19064 [Trichuris suis]
MDRLLRGKYENYQDLPPIGGYARIYFARTFPKIGIPCKLIYPFLVLVEICDLWDIYDDGGLAWLQGIAAIQPKQQNALITERFSQIPEAHVYPVAWNPYFHQDDAE